jgi:hypothetical protein
MLTAKDLVSPTFSAPPTPVPPKPLTSKSFLETPEGVFHSPFPGAPEDLKGLVLTPVGWVKDKKCPPEKLTPVKLPPTEEAKIRERLSLGLGDWTKKPPKVQKKLKIVEKSTQKELKTKKGIEKETKTSHLRRLAIERHSANQKATLRKLKFGPPKEPLAPPPSPTDEESADGHYKYQHILDEEFE